MDPAQHLAQLPAGPCHGGRELVDTAGVVVVPAAQAHPGGTERREGEAVFDDVGKAQVVSAHRERHDRRRAVDGVELRRLRAAADLLDAGHVGLVAPPQLTSVRTRCRAAATRWG